MKKMLFLPLLTIALANSVQSQTENFPQKIKFGFNIGTNYSYLNLQKSQAQSPVREITSYSGLGFRIGIIMDYYINKRFSFIPKSEMSFNSTGISVLYDDGNMTHKDVCPNTIDFTAPIALRMGDKRKSYVLVGPGARIPLTQKKYFPNISNISATTFCLDIGFGSDRALQYFILAPEIRYSYGINNISNIPGINKMQFHTLTLVLNFKG